MWAVAALLLASQAVGTAAYDTFCFDHSGKQSGREVAGRRFAVLPLRALPDSAGDLIKPTSPEFPAPGVPAACFVDGAIPMKAPYAFKLGGCLDGMSPEEGASVCAALCAGVEGCQGGHIHKFGDKDECRLFSNVKPTCVEFPFRLECAATVQREDGELAVLLCPAAPVDATKYAALEPGMDLEPSPMPPDVYIVGGVASLEAPGVVCREDASVTETFAAAVEEHISVDATRVVAECGTQEGPGAFDVTYWVHTEDVDAWKELDEAEGSAWLTKAAEAVGAGLTKATPSTWTMETFRESEVPEWPVCVDAEGRPNGWRVDPWHTTSIFMGVQMLPEDHMQPVPFTRSMARDTDLFPIPEGCFSDVTIDGTPDNPALIRKGKHYEFLGPDCLGDRTNNDMLRICLSVCAHVDYGGPGTRDARCWGVNYDEHGFLGHCHLMGPQNTGSQGGEICTGQGGDPTAGLGTCVTRPPMTPRRLCSEGVLGTDVCGMPNQLALMCHVPDIAGDRGYLRAKACDVGEYWDGKTCADAPPGSYTVQAPWPDRVEAMRRPPDFPGYINRLDQCPRGRVCEGRAGCAFDADATQCPGSCENMAMTRLLPNKPGEEGSTGCALLCGDLDEGVDWEATAEDPTEGIVLLEDYWREDGDPRWSSTGGGCLDTKRPWKSCIDDKACVGGTGSGDALCRDHHKGPYCEVCERGTYKSLDGTCDSCGSRSAVWISAASLVAMFLFVLLCVLILVAHAGGGDELGLLPTGSSVGDGGTPRSPVSDGERSPRPRRVSVAGAPPRPDFGGDLGDGEPLVAERPPPGASPEGTPDSEGGTDQVPHSDTLANSLTELTSRSTDAPSLKARKSLPRKLSTRLSEAVSRKSLARLYKKADDSALLLSTMQFLGNARSVINFLQITAKINVIYSLTWPEKLAKLFTVVDIATLNFFAIVPFGCLASWRWDFFNELVLVLCVMTGVNAFFFAYTALIPSLAKDERAARTYRRSSSAVWIIFNFLFYTYVVGTTFTAFPCTDTPSGDQSFLSVDMSINCGSSRYDAGFALAVTVGLVLYVIGIPFMMWWLVWTARKKRDEDMLDRLAILHLVYKPEWWFTEVIVCLEKVTIAGVLVFVDAGETTRASMRQAALGLAVSGFWLFFFASAHPFAEQRDNIIKDLCCLAQIFVMLGVILLKINFEAEGEFYNFSEDEIDTVLICVVCAPVAALLIPVTYKAIMKRVKRRRKAAAEKRRLSQRVARRSSSSNTESASLVGSETKEDLAV